MDKILVIIGPTATGKTTLGIELAKKYGGEIISADSRQVYRGMDITTGKDKQKYGDIPVWGLDLVDPDYNYNVSDFLKYTSVKIRQIWGRGKLPIVVGGTILYIKALLEPFETIDIPPNPKLRQELEKLSVEGLQKRLGASRLNESDFKNRRRLIRAIEVSLSKQIPKPVRDDMETTIINLTAPLDYIYSRIDARVDERIKQGAWGEYHQLLQKGYSPNLPSMTALGLKEVGNADLWKKHEHQYAKRQMTFIKKFLKGKEVIEWNITNEKPKNPLSF